MKYHVTGSKQVKECTCSPCRAKYGQYDSKEAAEGAVAALTSSDAELPLDEDFDEAAVAPPQPASEESPASPNLHRKGAAYFDDDKEFLKGDDEILAIAPDSALIQQMENVVSWRLENFYDENGERRGKYSLRADPPIFRVESADGAQAEFILTKKLALTMAETFDTVKRGYYGVDPKRKGSLTQGEAQSKFAEVSSWASAHPVKSMLLVLLFIFVVITAFTL